MKVLLINTSETKGGAAVAAGRLMRALQANGIETKLLVRDKVSSTHTVSSTITGFRSKFIARSAFLGERLQIFLANRFSKTNLFAVSTASTGFGIHNHPLVQEADVLHLHWINQGFISIHELGELIKLGKPIVWTMHDMWPITGICHHSRACKHYTQDCGNCMFLEHPSSKDLSYRIFKQKKQILAGAGISFVACSQWLQRSAEISSLRTGNTFTTIPNPLNTDQFSPGDQHAARKRMGLPLNKKLLLFGATIASDKRKGLDYLIEATHLLADLKDRVELILCGEVKQEITTSFGLKVHALGYISDMEAIVEMYRAADCFIIPSLEENLPNMIMESMACGIPCVGFEIGGIPEMIDHEKTGYVAKYKSAEDFASGIRFILDKGNDAAFQKDIRDAVLSKYSESSVAQRYINLYQKALQA